MNRPLWLNYFYLGLFLFLSVISIKFLMAYFLPFILAIVFALLIDPAVNFVERKLSIPRGVASAFILIILIFVSTFLIVIGVARLVAELANLSKSLPFLYREAVRFIEGLLDSLGQFSEQLPDYINQELTRQIERMYQALGMIIDSVLNVLQGWALRDLPYLVVILLIAGIATYFISKDKHTISKMFFSLLPEKSGETVRVIRQDIFEGTIGFLKAQLLLVLLSTIVTIAGLSLFGVEYAFLMGMIIGLLDLIPVIGPAIIYIPWIVYLIIIGDFGLAIGLTVLYIAISALRTVAQAYVMGETMGLHPLTTLIALYVGVKVFGAIGILVGPLLAIVIKSLVKSGIITLSR